jgi:hypothetical protein
MSDWSWHLIAFHVVGCDLILSLEKSDWRHDTDVHLTIRTIVEQYIEIA